MRRLLELSDIAGKMDVRVRLALIATVVLNLFVLGTEFWRYTYDGETHLFLADHYLRAWWDPWEEKWFGGFWVYSYPPLTHQLLALIGHLWNLELGYQIVQGAALLAFPVAVWFLAREIVGSDAAGWVGLLTLTAAGPYLSLYSFGQLANFIGVVLMLVSLAFLVRFLKSSRWLDLLGWAAFSGSTFASHHMTALTGVPLVAAAVVVQVWIAERSQRPQVIRRAVIAALVLLLALVVVLLPFWWWAATQRLPLAQMPHPTRERFLTTLRFLDIFFLREYGVTIFYLPLALLSVLRRRDIWPLMLLIGLLVTLGLGGNTPLPRLLLGKWWTYLVYERFAMLACIFLLLPMGLWLTFVVHRVRVLVLAASLAVGLIGTAQSAMYSREHELLTPPLQKWEIAEMKRFLESENHSQWRYITLGLGDSEFQHFSRLVAARTVDGYYPTARIRKELRENGIGSFDASIHFPGGLEVLRSVLEEPERWGLKFALVRDHRYDAMLMTAGWKRAYPIGSDAAWRPGDSMHSLVLIWAVPEGRFIPPVADVTPDVPRPLPLMWGVIPLVFLGVGLSVLPLAVSRRVRP